MSMGLVGNLLGDTHDQTGVEMQFKTKRKGLNK